MKETDLNKSGDIKEIGMVKFITFKGVLYQGIPVSIIVFIFDTIRSRGLSNLFSLKTIVNYMKTDFSIGIVAGIIYGLILWIWLKSRKSKLNI